MDIVDIVSVVAVNGNRFRPKALRIRCTEKDQADLLTLRARYGWKSYAIALRHLMLFYEGLETKTPIKTYGLEVTARSK